MARRYYMEKAHVIAAPGGYADEHTAHYTFSEITEMFGVEASQLEAVRYIPRGELILALRKPAAAI